MIGSWAFLEELSFVLVPLGLLLIVILVIHRIAKSSGGFSLKGFAALMIFVLLPTVFGWKFIREVRAQHFLRSLSVESVESISIAGQQVATPKEKAILIQALREAEWFSNHHGGWDNPVELRIRLRSGEERNFSIARYLREPGAVIEFTTPGRSGLHEGYGFSKSLPTALTQAGFSLPH